MAHIPDGVLSAPVLAAGAAIALAGCTYGLRRLDGERIPQVAVLSAVFFVASLVHFPVGPSSVHLILNGLTGIVLGWAAFPAILVALLLQAVLFGFGGLVVLGVNVMNMAVPAVLCRFLFLALAKDGQNRRRVLWAAGLAGGLGVLLTALLVAVVLALSGKEFIDAAKLVVLAHIPVAAIETVFSVAVISLLLRVKPEFLGFQSVEEKTDA
jgi:cobalt/nickel transport system permease protein